jgi:hypothetical protein
MVLTALASRGDSGAATDEAVAHLTIGASADLRALPVPHVLFLLGHVHWEKCDYPTAAELYSIVVDSLAASAPPAVGAALPAAAVAGSTAPSGSITDASGVTLPTFAALPDGTELAVGPPTLAVARAKLAACLFRSGRYAEARDVFSTTIPELLKEVGEASELYQATLTDLSKVVHVLNRERRKSWAVLPLSAVEGLVPDSDRPEVASHRSIV